MAWGTLSCIKGVSYKSYKRCVLQVVADASFPFVTLGGEGRIVLIPAMTEVELVHEVKLRVGSDVDIEVETIAEHALLSLVAPGVVAFFYLLLVAHGVFVVALECGAVDSSQDEELHEVEVVAEGETAVVEQLELVLHGESCAEVVATQWIVVRSATAEGDG